MVLLFVFTIFDFLITYYGISVGAIEELNPLHRCYLSLPFLQSLCIRILVAIVIITPFYLLYRLNRNIYRKTIAYAYIINIVVLGIHLYWIIVSL